MAAAASRLRDAEAWLAQYETATNRLDARTVVAVWAAYEVIDDWRNPGQTLGAATAASGTMLAAAQMQRGLAAEYIAVLLEIITGRRPAIPQVPAVYPRDAKPFDVYSRPIFDYRDSHNSLDAARERAEVLSLTDTLMARRAAIRDVLTFEPLVTHYRRVIRPELSTTGTCGLCIAAASRIYTIEDLLPIHTRCKCAVVPIGTDLDAGERFNLADIRDLYAATPGTSKRDLVNTRYRVVDLPELGPVLTPAA